MQPLSWFLPTESESSDDRSAASNPGQAPSAGHAISGRATTSVTELGYTRRGTCGGAGRNRTADKGFADLVKHFYTRINIGYLSCLYPYCTHIRSIVHVRTK